MQLAFPLSLLLLATTILADVSCNGNADLCDRLYSNVSQVGTHDSAFVGTLVTDNQSKSVADQLSAGIRFLQAQVRRHPGDFDRDLTTD